jgi:hypothetical protein
METRIYSSQSTNFTLDNTTENFNKYEITPTTSGLTYDFGTRRGKVIIHNKSYRYMLGDIKPDEISLFERLGNSWNKIILTQGNKIQYHSYTNTAPYNDAQLTAYLESPAPDVWWIKNGSDRTDHVFVIDVRPTRQGQELMIHMSNPANAHDVRINFGTGTAKVNGLIVYSSLDDTGGASGGGDPTAHTHESGDGNLFVLMEETEIGINEYVQMSPNTTLKLTGMKKPATTGTVSYYWTINHNITNSIPI